MTFNADEGTDLGPVVTATSLPQLARAVAEVFAEVQASNIPERAEGFARLVEANQPDIIALQELSNWYTGPLGKPATDLQFNALQSILDALAGRGLSYAPMAISINLDAEAPSVAGVVRLTDYDAVLVRTTPTFPKRSTRGSQFRVTNIQTGSFNTILSYTSPVPGVGTVTVPRGWISLDAMFNGKPFRFVTTHLESFDPQVRAAQALELAAGPLNTPLPVILAADLNSDANSSDPTERAAFQAMLNAGLRDAWSEIHPDDPGFTWKLHGEDPFTPGAMLSQRIDVILSRAFLASDVTLFGANPNSDLTPSGLWPSDHAGVAATIDVQPKLSR
jgi:endonuclease/exonuclease/phosphatase family metal-dependent hydrolase